jgi:hypothetical protein
MASVFGTIFRVLTRSRYTLLLCTVVVLGSWFAKTQAGFPSRKQNQARTLEAPQSIQQLDSSLPRQDESGSESPGELPALAAAVPKAIVRVEGKPIPGASVVLQGRESLGNGLNFRWVQVAGPGALPQDATQPAIQITMPADGQPVEFLLIVSNERGIDSVRVALPESQVKSHAQVGPVADAGDDQLAVVGRQVTLNGGRSEPLGRIGYRWVQVAGPKVRLKLENGPFLSFVPTAPGIYRFALLVAAGSQVSEPEEVTITVGAVASTLPSPATRATYAVPVVEEDSLDQVARRAVTLVQPQPEVLESLANTFEDIATRMDLYENYTSMFQELSQRLEAIIPAQPGRRKLWLERVFSPLTQGLIPLMQADGLDLSRPEGQALPLTSQQRASLAEQFRLIAEGFRAVKKDTGKSQKPFAINASTE